jgi:hypothetical protein
MMIAELCKRWLKQDEITQLLVEYCVASGHNVQSPSNS